MSRDNNRNIGNMRYKREIVTQLSIKRIILTGIEGRNLSSIA